MLTNGLVIIENKGVQVNTWFRRCGYVFKSVIFEKVPTLDDIYNDILWVKFWNSNCSFCVCVCYVPPDGSTRLNDAEEFYTRLTEQVY